ncbi:helix-turn-helix transcriptional regulator [Massilia horti]|uniref:AlpA family phage regulatory protein n=1 Tax=Massilia horti TaxID=2562153 RepID=A0A4Y9T310_9BURK|nr:AlpA family transcriptional regulator [Massilia horti]TFW33594.1 AlpA family phage regulatory protein [Massilia horti]
MATILRIKAVKELTGLGRSSIYDKIKRNEFPPPISLGPRAVGWLVSDLDSWIKAQAASSPRHVAWHADQSGDFETKGSKTGRKGPACR